MNHQPDTTFLHEWLVETEGRPPDPIEGSRQTMSRLPQTPQVGRWWPVAIPRSASRGARFPMVSATTFVAVAAIVAVLSGAMLLGALRPPGGVNQPPVAGAPGDSGQPAIHWRSGVVDLQADSMTLQVGDKTYTTEGVDVVVDSSDGLGQWGLYPRWVEDGSTFWLYLYFESDGEDWTMDPELWRDGVSGPGDEVSTNAPGDPVVVNARSGWVEFPHASITTPLGEKYRGDLRFEDRIMQPTCDPASPEAVNVTLSFDNLRLSVSPRQPSGVDQFLDDMFHRGSMLGDIFKGHLDPPQAKVLDCSDPG